VSDRGLDLAALVREMPTPPPFVVRRIGDAPPVLGGALGVLCGSFNPPTDAHVALAVAGRQAGLPRVIYLLGKHTVNKSTVTGIQLADRLALLEMLAEPVGDIVAFTNAGLYVDQAESLHNAFPGITDLAFLVGHDKIVQIFDPRYYEDRERALDRLFAAARFCVAPRAGDDGEALNTLLKQPENRRYADSVTAIALDQRLRDRSSSAIRSGARHGVPPVVASFLEAWRPYDDHALYAVRARALTTDSA
jgi:nicotinamide-nucleotide adenylyltransferase